jgi:hypothetical protein
VNIVQTSVRDCKLVMKTYQSISSSVQYLDSLLKMEDSTDFIVLSSVFQLAVIKYVKPFLNTNTSVGKLQYPAKLLKKIVGFKIDLHKHLIDIRHTLVAHDDFEKIEPHILTLTYTLENKKPAIPYQINISNKCVSHPAKVEDVKSIRNHVKATLNGVSKDLLSKVKRHRELILEYPDLAQEKIKYSKKYGKTNISKGGSQLTPPDISNDEWLNIKEPDFSEIHEGYRYESMQFRIDFDGPETIQFDDGSQIEIKPNPHQKNPYSWKN